MVATRLVIVGGFLGAGKTTLLAQAARRFIDQGFRVGLITNDQGSNLVDTALLEHQGFPVAEVAGSCFCCAFDDLLKAIAQLQSSIQPDIILAEPVGSCTDLLATVIRPLKQLFPEQFEIAPLSIVVDATRDVQTLSPNVAYLFERQIREADVILLNKTDLIDAAAQRRREDELQSQFPDSRAFIVSARSGAGIERWANHLAGLTSSNEIELDIDYARYAEAEAELAWLNVRGSIRASRPFLPRHWITQLFTSLEETLHPAPIAHIKAKVTTPVSTFKTSLTDYGGNVTWDVDMQDDPTDQLEFVLNARVDTQTARLQQAVSHSIEVNRPDPLSRYYLTHLECFRPLPPKPTHRISGNPKRAT
ncbi:MAG: hypothetical protein IPO91_07395 [Chloroflexi bacterium]|nr:hypothetical protein [Chloroflexota bacterium]